MEREEQALLNDQNTVEDNVVNGNHCQYVPFNAIF